MDSEQAHILNQTPKIPFHYANQHGLFIRQVEHDTIYITHRSDISKAALLEINRLTTLKIVLEQMPLDQFELALAKAYESGENEAASALVSIEENMDLNHLLEAMPQSEDLLAQQDDAPIIQLINALLSQAINQGASDIHFEVYEKKMTVRFRIDGVLRLALSPPRHTAALLVSRLKIMAKLDIAEKRLPQDGRIALTIAGRQVDVRLSTIPTHFSERVVLRLLDKQAAPLDLLKLGLPHHQLQTLRKLIHQPNGIILVTGPTGSGKTTTLYAALTELNQPSRNIMTVEDPIEYNLDGISQTQVNAKVQLDFARGLRSILRQDPDVIMVGEIRDEETANMAVQASLTGHLVLSTLHTNTAVGAITRLRDINVEPFLIASTLIGVLAQRLMRRLCQHCKRPTTPTPEQQRLLHIQQDSTIYSAEGCEKCQQTGFSGRIGIYELVTINKNMQDLIHNKADENQILESLGEDHRSLHQQAIEAVTAGTSSFSELMRVSSEERE